MRRDAVEVIEVAYRTEGTITEWLRDVANALPTRSHGLGIVAMRYRITETGQVAIDEQVGRGAPPELLPLVHGALEAQSPTYVRETFATLPCATALASGSAETRAQTRAGLEQFFGPFGVRDVVIVNAIDPTGSGVYFGELQSQPAKLDRRERATWSRVAAHLAASYRLRRSIVDEADAVISPSGRIEHATAEALSTSSHDALRRAAIAIDRARSKRSRTSEREAVELWQALVAGQWTLIDRVDHDGKRFFIARKNDPDVARHHALTRRERQVVGYAALGHSNKLIAYEMGLSVSSVAVYLDVAMEKLGLSSRAALIVAARTFGSK